MGQGEDAVNEHGSDEVGLRERREARHRGTKIGASHAEHDDVPLLLWPPDAREAPVVGFRGEVLAEPGGCHCGDSGAIRAVNDKREHADVTCIGAGGTAPRAVGCARQCCAPREGGGSGQGVELIADSLVDALLGQDAHASGISRGVPAQCSGGSAVRTRKH